MLNHDEIRKHGERSSKEWIQYVKENSFTPEELAELFCNGLYWSGLLLDSENLFDVVETFIDCGMDPNQLVYDDWGKEESDTEESEDKFYLTSLIAVTRFEDGPACAASLKMLLERGGDPNVMHFIKKPGEDGIDYSDNVTDFYYWDVFSHGPDLDERDFYGLLLCFTYGGTYHSGTAPFEMLIEAPPSVFKDYERYWFEWNDHEALYVIEKETGKRVAKWVF